MIKSNNPLYRCKKNKERAILPHIFKILYYYRLIIIELTIYQLICYTGV